MGLDMWIYKVGRASDEDVAYAEGKRVSELREQMPGHTVVILDGQDARDATRGILPVAREISVLVDYLDVPAMQRALLIPKYARVLSECHGRGSVTFGFYWECAGFPQHTDLTVTDENVKQFLVTSEQKAYIFRQEEVAYYRKHYKLQEALYDLAPIDNCIYVAMDEDMVETVQEYDEKFHVPVLGPDEMLAYYEWY